MKNYTIIMNDALAEAIKQGIDGIDSRICGLEREIANGEVPAGSSVADLVNLGITEMYQSMDVLKGTLARYEQFKKEQL